MKNRFIKYIFLLAIVSSQTAIAGPYADDLSKCLVRSTTKEDRIELVKWVFSASSSHPAVKSMVTVSAKQLDVTNQKIAGLFMRLLTETCRPETEKTLQHEGAAVFETSFQVLGRVAGQELFSSPEVAEAMSGLDKYIDGKKLEALAREKNKDNHKDTKIHE